MADRLLSVYNIEDIFALMNIDEGKLLTFLIVSGFMKPPGEELFN